MDYFEVWWSKIAYSYEESFSKAVFSKANPIAIPDVKQFVWFLTKFNGGIGECKPKHNVKDPTVSRYSGFIFIFLSFVSK